MDKECFPMPSPCDEQSTLRNPTVHFYSDGLRWRYLVLTVGVCWCVRALRA